MSPEAEVLSQIGVLAGLVSAQESGERNQSLSRESAGLSALAASLEMAGTAAIALRINRAAAAGNSVAELAGLLDQLQQTADDELTSRLTGTGSEPRDAAPPPEFAAETREHLEAIGQHLLLLEADPSHPDAVHAVFRGFHTIKGLAAIFEVPAVGDLAHQVETLLDQVRLGRRPVSAELIDRALESADRIGAMLDDPALTPKLSRQGPAPAVAARTATVRVETGKLDQMVDLVGELLIAQSMVASDPAVGRLNEPRLSRNLMQLARLTGQLQKAAMSVRLVPMGPAFQRLARAFRDLLRTSGKQARLELEGEDIELDRTILEQLADPLMHMVRNAVDHGLETPAVRTAAGKPEEGRLKLSASHQGGQVVIEVSDDGRGLDTPAIRRRAVERGLAAAGAELTPQQCFDLIFEPGFSTAGQVTGLSGRGVGMDVVKTQIEKLRGRVEIRSAAGQGTSFMLRLPLTLAIIDGLIVRAGGCRYIVPLFSVHEIVRPKPGSVFTMEGRSEAAMVRDRILPVRRLAALLGLDGAVSPSADPILIVTGTGGRRSCLMVDELEGKQQVVIKSLGEWLGHRRGISGAAILGDGSIGLILDLESLSGGGTASGAAA